MLLSRQLTLSVILLFECAGGMMLTQEAAAQAIAVQAAPVASAAQSSRPLWKDLSTSQQQALAPLTQLWPSMTEPHKRKWLALSQNFAQLSADEKGTLQGRMHEWAALSPQQRTAARLNFAGAQQMPQEDKRAKWEAYQALSPEAKQKLAAQQAKPVAGAAPAIKPIAADKLTSPPTASNNKPLPRIATNQTAPVTLLPTPATATNATTPATEAPVSPQ
jgi:hypothetical protein